MYDLAMIQIYTNIFLIISNRSTISHRSGLAELIPAMPHIWDRANSVTLSSQTSRRFNGVDKTSLIDQA
jgi:hypothetical protein